MTDFELPTRKNTSRFAELRNVDPDQIKDKMRQFVGSDRYFYMLNCFQYRWHPLPPIMLSPPWGEGVLVHIGVACLAGGALGSVYGLGEGINRARTMPNLSLMINSVLNAVGKRGGRAANALGAACTIYMGTSWALDYSGSLVINEENNWKHGGAAAAISGGIFFSRGFTNYNAIGRSLGGAVACGSLGMALGYFRSSLPNLTTSIKIVKQQLGWKYN